MSCTLLRPNAPRGRTAFKVLTEPKSKISGDKSFADDLSKQQGVVKSRVALLRRSSETKPFAVQIQNPTWRTSWLNGKCMIISQVCCCINHPMLLLIKLLVQLSFILEIKLTQSLIRRNQKWQIKILLRLRW